MAKSKKTKLKTQITEKEIPELSGSVDDIELLNHYKYADFYPQSTREKVMGSKNAQKRIEELLRDAPIKKAVKTRAISGRPSDFASVSESGEEGGRSESILLPSVKKDTENSEDQGGIMGAIRRWFP